MKVEIIGLPGVGKTTMIEAHKQRIGDHYTIVESRTSNLRQKIIAKWLFYTTYSPKLSDKNLAQKLAYRHSFRVAGRTGKPIFFYDSGMVQVVLENLVETDFADEARKLELLFCLDLPDSLIYLHDDLDAIIEREMARSPRRYGDLNRKTVHARYKRLETLIQTTVLKRVTKHDTVNIHQPDKFTKALEI